MQQQNHNTAKLPRQLLEELGGVSSTDYDVARKKRSGPTNRKEQRKAARVQKKSSHTPINKFRLLKQRPRDNSKGDFIQASSFAAQLKVKSTSVQPQALKSILKAPKASTKPSPKGTRQPSTSPSPPPPVKISRSVQDRLAADNAEIAALEKALGVKGKKELPKSFEADGLDSLLDGIDYAVGLKHGHPGKKKRNEGEEWLEQKRQKAWANTSTGSNAEPEDEDSHDGSKMDALSGVEGEMDERLSADGFSESYSFDEESDQPPPSKAANKIRENPYVAPTTSCNSKITRKYIPPSLRSKEATGSEDLFRLRRQVQGLLNRLSEANLISILGDVEKLYRDHPRQHVTTTLIDLLMALLSDPTTLQDTFVILHAGFIAAVYKVVGTDFGAQIIQKIDEEFSDNYQIDAIKGAAGKKLTNLISLLAELYNFLVIGSKLIYDFVRLCLEDLSETNTELLLKIIRNAGQQLRQDDPSSLKDIVLQLQGSVAKVGEERLSVRTKFMVETINNLKNNRVKIGIAATTITSEYTIRMKRTLGPLNTRTLKATEPLQIGMKDLRDRNKVGTWWLIGASYKGDVQDNHDKRGQLPPATSRNNTEELSIGDIAADLVQLAKEQRMNTDVRRSIFITIMSSTDYDDAYVRLMKLRLKRSQALEIPKVLVHCAGAEGVYNPFYTFLSRRVCSDKKLKMSFQFSLWDLLKQMGEGDEEPDKNPDEDEGKLRLRSLVNLARMFGVLVAEGGLGLYVLKNLNLAYLQPKTQIFVELLLITAILRSQQDSDGKRNEKALLDIFIKPKEMTEMGNGLQYFLKKVVRKTDVAGSKSDKETVRWGCKVAGDALAVIVT